MVESPLRKYRDETGMTQMALSRELGVSAHTIWRWEAGYRKVAIRLLPKISKVTGIPQRELRPDLAEILG